MYRIITTLICLFVLSCNPARQVIPQQTSVPIYANRIMIILKPMKEANIPLSGFLGFCDSVFKKNNITHTILPFNHDGFYKGKTNFYSETVKQFRPDCLILLAPKNASSSSVQYNAYIMPVDATNILLFGNQDNQPVSPTFVCSFNLKRKGTTDKSKQNGIQVADRFIESLKKHVRLLE